MIKKLLICLFVCCWVFAAVECESDNNDDKSPYSAGICTYRIIDLKSSRFQATETFTVKEKLAIIIKGYGKNYVTVKVSDSSTKKQVFKLTDYIPADKHKIWIWDSLSIGTFQAVMYINGVEKDDVHFKVVPERKSEPEKKSEKDRSKKK